MDTFHVWGKRVGPTPVARKRGHKFNKASLDWLLPASKMERHVGFCVHITFCMWGKRIGPTPVARKHGHDFNIALLDWWLPAGKMEQHFGFYVCIRQAD